ncbi:hypothetical protein [Leptospira ilyithenensis]|nr:hypothetical protein [Leptospira ilyithenensis]
MIRIRLPELFNYKEYFWFLNRNYDDCLLKIKDDTIYNSVVFEGKPLY